MNPYDFVRIDWSNEPHRRKPALHDKFSGVSGQLEGTITTEMPLFIPAAKPGQQGGNSQYFIKNGAGQAIIPGSSLKGLFRSLVETIAPGCWCLYRGTYRDRVDYSHKLPPAFHPCRQLNNLCPACRMFGLINRGTLFQGHVFFNDAVCSDPVSHEVVYTPILDGPKPRHKAWYLDASERYVAGRKYYFHQHEVKYLNELRTSGRGVPLNQKIEPIGNGSVFKFSASFENLSAQDELPALLYALTLEPTMRHKIGYAKPAGFGTIRVELTRVTVVDYKNRYSSGPSLGEVYQVTDLAEYLQGQTRPYANEQDSITLQDLRRIWAWPPDPNVQYAYPSRDWFNRNPTAPISDT